MGKNSSTPPPVEPVQAETSAKSDVPADTVKAAAKETNAAQTYIDAQKKSIQNAKDAVDKSQKATDDQLKQIEGL